MNRSSIKEILKNLLYSFASYSLPTVFLQFVIQPIIANKLGSELNGQYLTLMSLNYFMIGITAAVLNTVRMLQQQKYDELQVVGDFNIFYLIYSGILLVVLPAGYIYYSGSIDIVEIILYLVIGNLYLYHDYIYCQFRLKLQYNKILLDNIIQVVGYGAGILLFLVTGKWQVVYLSAYLLSCIFDYVNTDFIREPVISTPLLRETTKIVLLYSCSMLFSSMITYCDKLILYPILGGEAVSIYNTASIVGKMLILISAPLNSVLLSYLVKMKSLEYRINIKQVILVISGIVLAYGICVGVGYPLTNLLYPRWSKLSHEYIPIVVAASLINLIAGLFNTVLLRFCNMKFQIVIHATNLIVYLSISLILLRMFGLLGFCLGVTIAATIKLITMIIIFKKKNVIKEGDNPI